MKKLRMMVVLAFTLCLVLVGCGASVKPDPMKDFVGTWEAVEMVSGEETYDEALLAQLKETGIYTYLDLNADGSVVLNASGSEYPGTWSVEEPGKATLTLENAQTSVSLALDDGRLIVTNPATETPYTMVLKSINPADKIDATQTTNSNTQTDTNQTDTPDASDDSPFESSYYGGDTIEDLDNAVEMNVDLVDDDLCTMKIVAMGEYVGDPGFLFELTNKTDQDILFMSYGDWTAANGIVDDPVLYETLHAGETLQSIMWFNASVVGGVDPSVLKDVKGVIILMDATETAKVIASYDIAY